MIRIVLFIICTLFFIRFSWRSLHNPGSHGFYRFFVFESILLLILLNQPYWFKDPFSPMHIFSWFLLLCSFFFIIHSLVMLKQYGGHAKRHEMPENHSFENTLHVVDRGLYRYVRHPMYSSLLFLGWGALFKHITLINISLALLLSGFLIATAKVEERENHLFFGKLYEHYTQRTKMFIPWIL